MQMRIVPLPTAVVARWIERRVDDQGNLLAPIVVDRPHAFPCRHCLDDARPGEAVLLGAHSPFPRPGPYREVGPIFVHADGCARRDEAAPLPQMLRRRLLAVRGYDAEQRLVVADVVDGRELEPLLTTTLARGDVAYAHVRFAPTGCFACRVERA